MSTDCKPFRVVYEFNFAGGAKKSFSMDFTHDTYEIIVRRNYKDIPEWAKLEYRKCPKCPVDPETVAYCPVAFNISGLMHSFGSMVSTEKCFVRCVTYQRSYSKMTDVMSGLASALSLITLSSPCPYLAPFRSLARFHMPFFTPEESLVRTISFYLLSQYFTKKNCGSPDWKLEKLDKAFEYLKMLQDGMMSRTKGVFEGDACVNAMHSFHVMIEFISFEIESSLECLESFFYNGQQISVARSSLDPFRQY
ncbi:DUF6901 family protein [Desulforegula conservatrix]|uniref:DUF6901 family protein n=1 Tax=Desulforegula conservatrix TaxID=153026 RepID=UPI0004081287|nr:hypothetical protein [Desulforegula conservatrix]